MPEQEDGTTLNVRVTPRAKRDEIVSFENGLLKIRLKAPPVEGKANAALVRFLAEKLGVTRARIVIVRGETSRNKLVRIAGMDKRTAMELLER